MPSRAKMKAALERIANQGLGRYVPGTRGMIGDTGEPWIHWSRLAREALVPDVPAPTRAECKASADYLEGVDHG